MKAKQTQLNHKSLERPDVDVTEAIYRLLGLAKRAGRTICGTEAVHKALRQSQAHLVIVAEDAADRTNRQMKEKTTGYQVPMAVFGQKQEIGHWTGSTNHAVVAILDTHFAGRLMDLIREARAC
ncbi:MAG: 50S ribosomal protein L7ae [Clostridiaceae bacterium]|nr:ribosomal L7Ae/L30e/S12e/Gadd45 family protein [Eubacteriales bacterium]NLV48735.1 50S ribosomal protein L7ae [Clostridiaceae bacterium]